MANLIITIIGIALLAIVAIAGIMYASTTMDSANAKAWANAMTSQNQQLIAAGNLWSVNNGGAGYSTFGFSDLINNGYLSQWPEAAMVPGAPNTGSFTTGVSDNVCPYNVNGYQGNFSRWACSAPNGVNVIFWYFKLNDPYNGTCGSVVTGNGYGFEDARYANHPIVQMALAINKIIGAVPASATIAGSGLPYLPAGSSTATCNIKGTADTHGYTDASGNFVVNYCYLRATGGTSIGTIGCAFTN